MYQIAVTDFSLHAINIKHFQNQYGTVWPTFSVLIVGLYNPHKHLNVYSLAQTPSCIHLFC